MYTRTFRNFSYQSKSGCALFLAIIPVVTDADNKVGSSIGCCRVEEENISRGWETVEESGCVDKNAVEGCITRSVESRDSVS
jgi:hypothetical protein